MNHASRNFLSLLAFIYAFVSYAQTSRERERGPVKIITQKEISEDAQSGKYFIPEGMTGRSVTNFSMQKQNSILDFDECEERQPPLIELKKIFEKLDFNSCFNFKSNNKNLYDPTHLRAEVESCRCLKGFSSLRDVEELMSSSKRGKSLAIESRLKLALRDARNKVFRGIAHQAAVVAERADDTTKKKFVGDYSKPISLKAYAHKRSEKIQIEKLESDLGTKDYSNIASEAVPYPPILNSDGSKVSVCISMFDFHRFRQFPKKSELESFLGQMKGDYRQSDWDYKSLEDRYDEIMSGSPAERKSKIDEITILKSKLSFLNRNPLIKYTFGATSEDLKSIPNGERISSQDFNLAEKKKDLFNRLKSSFGSPFCLMPKAPDECGTKMRENLNQFFGDKDHSGDIAEVVRSQSKEDIQRRVQKTTEMMGKMLPLRQLNKPALLSKYSAENGNSKPDKCDESQLGKYGSTENCLKSMSAFCSYIQPYEQQIMDDAIYSELEVADTLQLELDEDSNYDSNSNKAFQKANINLCHTPRKRSDGSSVDTFFEFKDKFCKVNGSSPDCTLSSPEHWYNLRKKYRSLYDFSRQASQEENVQAERDYDYSTVESNSRFFRSSSNSPSSVGGNDPFLSGTFDPNCKKFCVGKAPHNYHNSDNTIQSPKDSLPIATDSYKSSDASSVDSFPPNFYQGNTSLSSESFSNSSDTVIPNLASRQVQEKVVDELEDRVEEARVSNPNSEEFRALQDDLAAIRAAFAQSQASNKSLNDKLGALEKAQEIMTRNNLAPTAPEELTNSPAKGRFSSSVYHPRAGLSDLDRSISSVRENQTTSAATKGSSVANYVGSRARINGGSESSTDAVRREEGKLINVESSIDGRLTVTTASRGAGSTANALSVEVPLNLYQTIQSNPEGIDLSKIRISEEQMAQVQNREFTLLVNSGDGNPPFKVQVQIKNKRLVRADRNNDGQPDKQVQTVRLNDLNLVFRPLIQAQAN